MTTFAEGPSAMTADGALVSAHLAGDRTAFKELYDRYQHSVLMTLRAKVDRSLAEELAQEAWSRAMQYAASFDVSKNFGPWVRTIAIHLVPGELARRGTEIPMDDLQCAEPLTPDPAETLVEIDRIQQCLTKLTPRQRQAIWMRYMDDMDANSIAALLGLKRNAVEQLLLRARNTLRDLYGPREAGLPVLTLLGARFRRIGEAVAARFNVAAGSAFSAAGDVAIGAALTIGGIGLVQGMTTGSASAAVRADRPVVVTASARYDAPEPLAGVARRPAPRLALGPVARTTTKAAVATKPGAAESQVTVTTQAQPPAHQPKGQTTRITAPVPGGDPVEFETETKTEPDGDITQTVESRVPIVGEVGSITEIEGGGGCVAVCTRG